MGVGDPIGIVEAVARGVDLFDCVLPTRLARHGTVLTSEGRLNLRNARFARDEDPLDPGGPAVCRRWSRAYLRHLLMVDEPTAARLLTLHNLAWVRDLVTRTREAVLCGRLDELRLEVTTLWSSSMTHREV
jgi:queuine tRNA-ribosyltransferase